MMKMSLPTLQAMPALSSIDAYIHYVNSLPKLEAQAEQELAEKFIKNQDLNAARQLVLAHLRYVVMVAKGYMGYGLPLNDLIQEGNIGLMKAVKRFDPSKKIRLVTFAVHWIRAEIHEFILRNWRIVKIATTKEQRKLFFNLRSLKNKLSWFTKDEVATVAQDLGVKPEAVVEMEARLHASDASLDIPNESEDGSSHENVWMTKLVSPHGNPADQVLNSMEDAQSHTHLHKAIASLDDRSRTILEARWLSDKKATLDTLAKQFNVSAERVRQLENAALSQLKKSITADL
jgi:RNA polymerase sigma-32 factor